MKTRSQWWYASDWYKEALIFQSYMEKHDRKIDVNRLSMRIDFSYHWFQNILDPLSLTSYDSLSWLWQKVSWLYSYKDTTSCDSRKKPIPWNVYGYIEFIRERKKLCVGRKCFEDEETQHCFIERSDLLFIL